MVTKCFAKYNRWSMYSFQSIFASIMQDQSSGSPRPVSMKGFNNVLCGLGIIFVTFIKNSTQRNDLIIKTLYGEVKGIALKTSNEGKAYTSFKGIPYAKPPVGALRFQPPQPMDPWIGILEAKREGHSCPQVALGSYAGFEDCLYLNAYIPVKVQRELLPVIVWIHGGGFHGGSGDADGFWYGPDLLLEEGLIVITLNYRLGALGYLRLSGVASGNMGLKDQQLALRWVRDNIGAFGGDPGRVTLMGESAGAAAVHYHTLSPTSAGLFNAAIVSSGCALNPWAWMGPRSGNERSRRLVRLLGCDSPSTDRTLQCLQQRPARDLIHLQFQAVKNAFLHQLIGVAFVPTSEGSLEDDEENNYIKGRRDSDREDEESFLDESPRTALQAGRTNDVPIMFGHMKDEGMFFMDKMQNTNVSDMIDMLPEYMEPMIEAVFREQAIERRQILSNVIMDVGFSSGIDESARLHADVNTTVYMFHFAYDGRSNFHRYVSNYSGATHGDDLPYYFYMDMFRSLQPNLEPDAPEYTIAKKIRNLFGNFAKTGSPTLEPSTFLPLKWPPMTHDNPAFLNIDVTFSVDHNLNRRRNNFWQSIMSWMD